MVYEIENQKKKLLEISLISPTPQNLKLANKILCKLVKIKPAKINFNLTIFKNRKSKETVIGKYTHKIIGRNKIEIVPNSNWLLTLFHEVTHQIIFKNYADASHSKMFYKLYVMLLKLYFTDIVNVLKETQNGKQKQSK